MVFNCHLFQGFGLRIANTIKGNPDTSAFLFDECKEVLVGQFASVRLQGQPLLVLLHENSQYNSQQLSIKRLQVLQ